MVLAAGLALYRSNKTTIVVYNDSSFPLVGVLVKACQQQFTIRRIEPEDSYRIQIAKTGSESDVDLAIPMEPPVSWKGGYIEPRGGYRIELRVLPDMSIKYSTQTSVWQRLF